MKIEYNELKNDQSIFNAKLSSCNSIFILKAISKFGLNDFLPEIRSCISAFLIANSHQIPTKYRYKKFKSKKEKLSKLEIFDEDYFIELRIVGIGSIFTTVLNYHIYKEKIFVIKKPNILSDEIPKLLKREIDNYSKISHFLLPRYYGTIKKKTNYPVIEFINGQTLFDIKNLHLTEFEKFSIMLDLLSLFGYFQENHFIYRDLKPDNIMIDQNKTICLTDFDRMILGSDESNTVDLSPCRCCNK